jgi:hypothetical protein
VPVEPEVKRLASSNGIHRRPRVAGHIAHGRRRLKTQFELEVARQQTPDGNQQQQVQPNGQL